MENFHSINPQGLVASFFFDGRGVRLQKSALGMYRTTIHQLLQKFPDDFAPLVRKFQENTRSRGPIGKDWDWLESELRGFFMSVLPRVCANSPAFLFIDALDEVGEDRAIAISEDCDEVLRSGNELKTNLRICISCRHYPDIADYKDSSITVEDENRKDISLVVKEKLDNLPRLDDFERLILESELIEHGAGIFQWATLVLQEGKKIKLKGKSISALEPLFKKGPANLDDLYEYVLNDCESRSESVRLFQWILFAMEPVPLEGLCEAIALSGDFGSIDLSDYPESYISGTEPDQKEDAIKYLSKGLLEIKHHEGHRFAQFIHQSVPDYLLHKGLQILEDHPQGSTQGRGHFQISRSCMHYLLIDEVRFNGHVTERQLPEALVKTLPLIGYAWKFWRFHVIEAEMAGMNQADLVDIATRVDVRDLAPRCPAYTNLAFFALETLIENEEVFLEFVDSGVFDHQKVSDEKKEKLAWWAAGGGYESALKLLIGAGAGVEREYESRTPISLAAEFGHASVTKLLIEAEADLSWCNYEDQFPLGLAAENGHDEVVELLLGQGVDPNEKGWFDETAALGLVSQVSTAKILLAAGAEVDVPSPFGKWSLAVNAAAMSNTALLRVLLEAECEQNTTKTTLVSAVQCEDLEEDRLNAMRTLLNVGAEVEAKNEYGQSALAIAVSEGYVEEVTFLLERGADVNSRDDDGLTPLHHVVVANQVEICRLLVGLGRTIAEAVDNVGRTPLMYAVLGRYSWDESDGKIAKKEEEEEEEEEDTAILEILLRSRPVNVNARDNNWESALSFAVQDQKPKNIEILLGHRTTNPNIRDRCGRTSLMQAAKDGNVGFIRQLLAHDGIEPDLLDRNGKSALLFAVRSNDAEVVRTLLGTGRVRANSKPDVLGMTPLLWATIKGSIEMVGILLDAEEFDGQTIQAADEEARRRKRQNRGGIWDRGIVKQQGWPAKSQLWQRTAWMGLINGNPRDRGKKEKPGAAQSKA
ncbi:hypothetical protein SLS56_001135 [Neofusicoccum ribis]|uniref:Nephrocystin 3-like N-terminal domain-containing protein n=1 Tax=Neofusicoccum ribis TaxID=45134 RepID=A0ABR3TAH1_9PEZI